MNDAKKPYNNKDSTLLILKNKTIIKLFCNIIFYVTFIFL